MNEGILLASDIDFMIHGIFKVKVFGQEVWITDSHACILIVMAVMVIFAVIANRKLKHATEKPDTFQNIIELIVEKLDGMVDSTMASFSTRAPANRTLFATVPSTEQPSVSIALSTSAPVPM